MKKVLKREALESFGFKNAGDVYVFDTLIADNQLKMTVTIDENSEISTRVVDISFGDEYTLHLVEGANGSFVGQVRDEHERVLKEIEDTCFERGYTKYPQTEEIIETVAQKYAIKPECPFADDNETIVFRRKDNQKWFGIIMSISPEKLGLKGKEKIDVMNIKIDPEELNRIVDNQNYFRAYHMNKKMWTTVILDGRLPTKEIMERIENSFNLVGK